MRKTVVLPQNHLDATIQTTWWDIKFRLYLSKIDIRDLGTWNKAIFLRSCQSEIYGKIEDGGLILRASKLS